MAESIRIDGLDEFQSSISALGRELPNAVRMALGDATDLIADDARRNVARRTGAAAGSVRVVTSDGASTVTAGGPRAPYFGWLDFGGTVGRGGSVRRPFLPDGRYVYNAFVRHRGEFDELGDEVLTGAARAAGMELG